MLEVKPLENLRGVCQYHQALAPLTSWKVGGKADLLFQPEDMADLSHFLQQLDSHIPITWLGLGSNVLIRDSGLRGAVILTHQRIQAIELIEPQLIRVEAGLACAKVANFCIKQALGGGEFLAGIPGTMGGALAMNAGAWGGQTWEIVAQVETIDRLGQIHVRQPQDFDIAYREVTGPPDEWFVAAYLRLQASERSQVKQTVQSLLRTRSDKQPTGKPCAGSVFRNPDNDFAARLVESCGLKGKQIGQARVSEKHANFIINLGQAKSQDVEDLMTLVHDEVQTKHHIDLIREVHILGD